MPSPRPDREALAAWLRAQRRTDGGWPYYAGRRSRLEPTCWSAIALRVAPRETAVPMWPRADGLIVEPATGLPNVAFNGLAAFLLAALPDGVSLASAVVEGLMRTRGVTLPPTPSVRQDPSLQAWPWMAGTFSWVEPTAWCLLALKRQAAARTSPRLRARIEQAERLLADRACPGGGWNYGNGSVLGQELPAHVPTTAAAILALQDLRPLRVVDDAADWLTDHAVREGSTAALALAWLALRVLGRTADDLAPALRAASARAPVFGNVAAAAMLLYALDCEADDTEPAALKVA